ncbi:19519_t:CDS:2 [Racocetra persica]|uniref:19519_t:CDS:1 n=1 Tax=Racocetra persica TaxID=160502 RepID=A0ACA9NU03_9GLOM|nr:19519_t:CDS:2 [Racocetra persica]
MQSELDLLKQRITELEAENIELKHENTKLKQIIEENVGFKAKIVKLERAVDKIEKRDQSISRASKANNDSPTNSSYLNYLLHHLSRITLIRIIATLRSRPSCRMMQKPPELK